MTEFSQEPGTNGLNTSYLQQIEQCFQNMLSMTALSVLDSTQELSQSTDLGERGIHLIIIQKSNDNSKDTIPPAILPSDNSIVPRKPVEVPDNKRRKKKIC